LKGQRQVPAATASAFALMERDEGENFHFPNLASLKTFTIYNNIVNIF